MVKGSNGDYKLSCNLNKLKKIPNIMSCREKKVWGQVFAKPIATSKFNPQNDKSNFFYKLHSHVVFDMCITDLNWSNWYDVSHMLY